MWGELLVPARSFLYTGPHRVGTVVPIPHENMAIAGFEIFWYFFQMEMRHLRRRPRFT